MEGFEAKHGTCNSFDEPMVLFNDVVEIFRLHNAGEDGGEDGGVILGIESKFQTKRLTST